ncbi:MAG: hypothetical protein ABI459_00040 [Deltaproteobacteria bacterium]
MTHQTTFFHSTRRYLAMVLFGAICVTALTAAAARAAAVHIDCPVDQIRREITSPLPGGWWNTPIVNNLSETKVMNIGGEPALICIYASSGSIQRKAPAGATCTAVGGGFNCTSGGGVVAPQTYSTGPINLKQTYLADFDENAGGNENADIWFEAVTATQLYLTPRNGAKFALGNLSNRGFAGCSSASYSGGRVALSDVPVGAYVCVKTNQGRISQFRLNGITGGSVKKLQLGYTTWQ